MRAPRIEYTAQTLAAVALDELVIHRGVALADITGAKLYACACGFVERKPAAWEAQLRAECGRLADGLRQA